MIREGLGKRMLVVMAVAAALCLQGEAASASEAEAGYAIVDQAAPASLQAAASEMETLRVDNGEIGSGNAEASMAKVLESAQSEGKGFSVFCISLAVSLALMLGIFGLMLRGKKRRSR